MATKGADIVCINTIVWKVREAIELLNGLPEGDDYNATLDSLEEALNAAESWAMDPKGNEESAARQQAWIAADPTRTDADDTPLRAIFGAPVEGRDFDRTDGETELREVLGFFAGEDTMVTQAVAPGGIADRSNRETTNND